MILRVAGVVVLLFGMLSPAPVAAADPPAKTPIKHLLMLLQENHSFDNYFGTYAGADGIPADTCMPFDPVQESLGCVAPFHLGDLPISDLLHTRETFVGQYRAGRMNGFVSQHLAEGGLHSQEAARLTMGYYDDRDIPFYWDVARNYVLFDRFFSSAAAGSFTNHMYWVTGGPGDPNRDSPPTEGFGYDVPTIFDRLDEAGISWKFYVQNYDPSVNYRTLADAGDKAAQAVVVPLLNFNRFLDDPRLFAHIVDMEEYYTDLRDGTLPTVAYMAPLGSSEDPPGSIQAGQRFVETIVNGLMRSDYWDSSAFLLAYGGWGGWYDHVKPTQVDAHGYGFRVPALLVSAYARQGAIDSTTLDYTSVLKFIEANWHLRPLADRDAAATSIVSAFDFTKPPRPPAFLSVGSGSGPRVEPNRAVLYAAYAAAVVLALLLLLWAIGPGLVARAVSWRAELKSRR